MKAFILAAGYGERLLPFTEKIPKPLMPVMNLPAIDYSIALVAESGIRDIIINLHYRPDDIRNHLEEQKNHGLNIEFSVEGKLLGTGGGIKKCEHFLDDDDFVIINSDIVCNIQLADLIQYHRSHRAPGTVVLYRTEKAEDIGAVAVEEDRVIDFRNALGSGVVSPFIYTGIAVMSPEIFSFLKNELSSIVYTGYTGLINRNSLRYYEHSGLWRDIGSIDLYWKANMEMMSAGYGMPERIGNILGKKVTAVSAESDIRDGAVFEQSVIGKGCMVENGAAVRRSVIIGPSVIQAGEQVENAVVRDGSVCTVAAD